MYPLIVKRIILLLALLFLVSGAEARISGIDSSGDNGCVCHGGQDDISVSIDGFPERFESNVTYSITITIESDIPVTEGAASGGFRLLVSDGNTSIVDGQELDGGITHTNESNSQRSWNGTWVAPESQTGYAEIILHGNAVDGNGDFTGDEWRSLSMIVPGMDYEGDAVPSDVSGKLTSMEIAIGSLAVILLAVLAWNSSRD
jgi:hypothetical protein